jgi:cytochrome c peroxidase
MKVQGVLFTLLVYLLSGCSKDAATETTDDTLNRQLIPAGFPAPVYTFITNSVSCASCHKQEFAFADGGAVLSTGVYGRTGKRHSPAMFNLAWNKSFMWDGGVNHIEVMPLAPLTNPAEMGETISGIVDKLHADTAYRRLFKAAFGKEVIESQQMFWALAQFMGNLVSADSRYDRYIKGKETFSDDEVKGLNLFRANCESCHKEPLFTDYSFQNNGLDSVWADSGRYRITKVDNDWGRFKVPSLRNIAVTYPYMHDGRFASLEAVLTHYSNGVVASAPLSAQLVKDGKPGLNLTKTEQEQIIAFLRTLTDETFLNNPAYRE